MLAGVVTFLVNWVVKPFSMALLAWVFFRIVFVGFISPAEADQYIAGCIILAAAPCTAMVFVWSHLTNGDPAYTLMQVSVNDLIMMVLFVPVVQFLVSGASSLTSHAGIHLCFQADNITGRFFHAILIAVPITIQVYFNAGLAFRLMKLLRVEQSVAAPAALIGASTFFALAVATAIALFGPESGASLATVMGVLVEVPVMLSVCAACNRTRDWFPVPTVRG